MKVFNKSLVASAIFALSATFGVAHAAGSSSDDVLVVGNPGGNASLGVAGFFGGAMVPATHFAIAAAKDSNDVYDYSGLELVTVYGAPAHHMGMGIWSFMQVGSEDVYFGEWYEEDLAAGVKERVADTHTVFYVGGNPTTSSNVPTVSATYSVDVIRDYNGTLPAQSTLTASFGASNPEVSSTGYLSFSGAPISIQSDSVTFAGSNATVGSDTAGAVQGQFYGNQASAVAGYVTFSDRDKDAAFGGLKN